MAKYVAEPFRIKMVEPIRKTTREEREQIIKDANYNMFNIHAEDVYIDLLTDSGTGAMSQEQWGAMMIGDEAYAHSRSYFRFIDSAKDVFGDWAWFQLVHQGRAAEKVLMPLLLDKEQGKDVAISNTFFDTTRGHVMLTGATPIDCVVEEAKDSKLRVPFKGNMDTKRLRELIAEYGDRIGVVVMTITNNSAGGQPVSVANIKETSAICKEHNIPFCIDAARYAENAFFIKRDEAGYQDKTIKEIVREVFSYADYFTMSAKKDAILNMGGLVGVKDPEAPALNGVKANAIVGEGFLTYGGLNGRDIDAFAVGLQEGTDYHYLEYRIGQVEYLAERLDEAGIVYQAPVGGHGLFVDAAAMFPNIPWYEFPGQVLAVELYKEAGIRSCEIGSLLMDHDAEGNPVQSAFEFTRLAIPRRVYTQAHFDVMADALIEIKKRADKYTRGFEIAWEPPVLRHFQVHLKPIE
ncbi:MAG: tryptophanase [Bacilli bacterium]|jgi:tryptophanase|nr:tryptophanase [Bacilli bacterium]